MAWKIRWKKMINFNEWHRLSICQLKPVTEIFQITIWSHFQILYCTAMSYFRKYLKSQLHYCPSADQRLLSASQKKRIAKHYSIKYLYIYLKYSLLAQALVYYRFPVTSSWFLVHTAVCLSAIVRSPAPLGPRWPTYTVALPAGPEPAYSTNPDTHKIESLTQNTKLYPIWQRSRWSRGETDLTVQ